MHYSQEYTQLQCNVIRIYTASQKKVLTFKLSVALSNLNQFSIFCTGGKRMKFAAKPSWHRPPHLRHVATIPWETKNSNFCRYSADMEENISMLYSLLTLLFVHKCLSPCPLQINYLCHFSYGYLLLQSICGIKNSSQQMSLQCLSMINIVISDRQDFDKKFVFEGLHSKEVDIRISWEMLDRAWR